MSDAPAWLVELLDRHDSPDKLFGGCTNCGDDGDWSTHVAGLVWTEMLARYGKMTLQGERGPEFVGEPRVIPSRTGDPATSHAAAKAIGVKAGTQRARLLRVFDEVSYYTDEGLTDEEAAEIAPLVSMSSEYSKRCSELREAGYIEPTGKTRANGASGLQRIVSRITDKGREAVKGL